jgi:ribonuclease HIII
MDTNWTLRYRKIILILKKHHILKYNGKKYNELTEAQMGTNVTADLEKQQPRLAIITLLCY